MECTKGMGVRRKKSVMMKKKKKDFLGKVVEYLKSDSFMYSQLLLSSSSFPAENASLSTTSSTSTGMETNESIEENKRGLCEKFWEYIKSDTYLYAPLVGSQSPRHSAAGTIKFPSSVQQWHFKKLTRETILKKISSETKQSTQEDTFRTEGDKRSNSHPGNENMACEPELVHHEVTK